MKMVFFNVFEVFHPQISSILKTSLNYWLFKIMKIWYCIFGLHFELDNVPVTLKYDLELSVITWI